MVKFNQDDVGKILSERLFIIMQQRGMSSVDLSIKSGIMKSGICRYLNYQKYKVLPSLTTLCAIAQALNVSIDWLLGNYENCEYASTSPENVSLLFAYSVASETDKKIIDTIIGKYQKEKVQE